MTAMESFESCEKCGNLYNVKILSNCPKCGHRDVYAKKFHPEEGNVTYIDTSDLAGKEKYRINAFKSSLFVETWGRYLQIFGTFLGLCNIFSSIYLGYIYKKLFIGITVGVLSGLVTFSLYLVFGSIWRMLSNYVLFRTSKE